MSSWKKTFYASLAAQFCSIAGFSLAMPFMAFYIRELGVTGDAAVARWAGIVNASAAVTMAIFAPIWGVVADRFGRRLMVMRSMFGGAVVLVLMAFAQNVYQLAACRMLQGVLTGTISALLALVAAETPRERTGYALGMMQAAVFVGFAIGPLFGGQIADALLKVPAFATGGMRYRALFAASALFLLVGGLLVKSATHETFRPVVSSDREERGTFGQVFMATGFLAAVLALFMLRFANSVPAPVFALFVEKIHGTTEGVDKVVGNLMGVGGLAAAAGAFVLGRVSDTWGHRRLLIVSSTFTGAVSMVYYYATSVGQLYGLRILFGLGGAGILPAANAIIRNVTHDKNIGKAYGVTAAVGSIGWAFGPLTGGYLAGVAPGLRGLRLPFLVMGAGLLLSAFVIFRFVRPDVRSSAHAQGGETMQ